MTTEQLLNDLWRDYLALCEKYQDKLPVYEFGYALIKFNVKMLMDTAPRHKVALETIKFATEDGIKWHVEEREDKQHKHHGE